MLAYFVVCRLGIFLKESLCPHYHPGNTVSALRSLLILKRLLQYARTIDTSEALEGSNPPVADRAYRRQTGEYGLIFDMDRARSALAQPATILRAIEFEFIAQNIQERSIRIGRNFMVFTVYDY